MKLFTLFFCRKYAPIPMSLQKNISCVLLHFFDCSFTFVFSNPQKIASLLYDRISDINKFPKAKAAKVIRNLIETVSTIPSTENLQIELCNYLVEWCNKENITYLRHRV